MMTIYKIFLSVSAFILGVLWIQSASANDLVDVSDTIASGALATVTELAGSKIGMFVFFFMGVMVFVVIVSILRWMISSGHR